jgi:hypothetical protein
MITGKGEDAVVDLKNSSDGIWGYYQGLVCQRIPISHEASDVVNIKKVFHSCDFWHWE